jgi:hypothetical protein
MKKILMYLTVFVFLFASSCTDELTDLNVDPKKPQSVPYTSLFANGNVALFKRFASTNVNYNTFRLWAQHWAQTQYPDESNFNLTERNANGRWFTEMYSVVLRDLGDAKPLITEDQFLTAEEKANTLAIIELLEVYTYATLVDIFSDVPYGEALTTSVTPSYDVDEDIYNDIITRLDAAIGKLSGATGLGGNDLVYGGDAASWRKFGNSLKLRLAIRIADANSAKAKTMAEQAVADGVFDSSADDFELVFTSATPNTNPLWEDLVQSGRTDFIAGNTLGDYMNSVNDPRGRQFFNNLSNDSVIGGVVGSTNTYSTNSQPGDKLLDPTWPGTILSYTEVEFLLADAVERGYSVGGTAAGHYEAAVRNSIMVDWGGTQQEADDYYSQAMVDYATAQNNGTFKEKIGFQKWIAMYDQGFEAWTAQRMYDYPAMNVALEAETTPPTRWTYPTSEFSLNGESVEAAVARKGGTVDDPFSKVFWDKF